MSQAIMIRVSIYPTKTFRNIIYDIVWIFKKWKLILKYLFDSVYIQSIFNKNIFFKKKILLGESFIKY